MCRPVRGKEREPNAREVIKRHHGPRVILSLDQEGLTNLSDGEFLCSPAKLLLQRLLNLDHLEAAEEAENKNGIMRFISGNFRAFSSGLY